VGGRYGRQSRFRNSEASESRSPITTMYSTRMIHCAAAWHRSNDAWPSRAGRRAAPEERALRIAPHRLQGQPHEPRDRDGRARRAADRRAPGGGVSRRRRSRRGARRQCGTVQTEPRGLCQQSCQNSSGCIQFARYLSRNLLSPRPATPGTQYATVRNVSTVVHKIGPWGRLAIKTGRKLTSWALAT